MLLDHLDGILNYCRIKVPLGVVEAVNGTSRHYYVARRGYKNLRYLLLKAQREPAMDACLTNADHLDGFENPKLHIYNVSGFLSFNEVGSGCSRDCNCNNHKDLTM
jgi:hypothetical protein